VRCHCCLDIFDPEDEVTLKYFSTSVLCHGCRGYPALEEIFFDFFKEKEKKEKKQEGTVIIIYACYCEYEWEVT
jgi:hypothetical protein